MKGRHSSRGLASGCALRRYQDGVTLVEVMISLAIGLFMIVVIAATFLQSRDTFRANSNLGRIQETGRFALEAMAQSIRQAGFSGVNRNNTFTGVALVATNGTPASGSNPAGSDSITVSYADTVDCAGQTVAGGLLQNTYSLDSGTGRLMCQGNGGAAGSAAVVLADDVQEFQLTYGIDLATVGTANRPSAATMITSAPTVAQLAKAVFVRTCVLVRSRELGVTPTAQRYTDCGGSATLATDTRLRQRFVLTVLLRNQVS